MILTWDRDFSEQVIFSGVKKQHVLTLYNFNAFGKAVKKRWRYSFTDFCDFYSIENFPMPSY